jgi:hypothetical protein
MYPGLGPYRNSLPPNAEKDIVQKKERNGGGGNLCPLLLRITWNLCVSKQNRDHQVAKTLTCSGIHHHLPTAPSFNVGDSNQAEQKV